jgi:hypothetical protein
VRPFPISIKKISLSKFFFDFWVFDSHVKHTVQPGGVNVQTRRLVVRKYSEDEKEPITLFSFKEEEGLLSALLPFKTILGNGF